MSAKVRVLSHGLAMFTTAVLIVPLISGPAFGQSSESGTSAAAKYCPRFTPAAVRALGGGAKFTWGNEGEAPPGEMFKGASSGHEAECEFVSSSTYLQRQVYITVLQVSTPVTEHDVREVFGSLAVKAVPGLPTGLVSSSYDQDYEVTTTLVAFAKKDFLVEIDTVPQSAQVLPLKVVAAAKLLATISLS